MACSWLGTRPRPGVASFRSWAPQAAILVVLMHAGVAGAQAPSFSLKWGIPGSGPGQFNNPYDVAVDPAGFVLVADGLNNRVQKFTLDGTYVTQWGSNGTGD